MTTDSSSAPAVPQRVRLAKRAVSTALLVSVLATLAAPAASTLAYGFDTDSRVPLGLSRPLDGVGDSPVMP